MSPLFGIVWLCIHGVAAITRDDLDDYQDDDDYDDYYDGVLSTIDMKVVNAHVSMAEGYIAKAVGATLGEIPAVGPILTFLKGVGGLIIDLFKDDPLTVLKQNDKTWYNGFYNVTTVARILQFMKFSKDTACKLGKKLIDIVAAAGGDFVNIFVDAALQLIPGWGTAKFIVGGFLAAMHIIESLSIGGKPASTDAAVKKQAKRNEDAKGITCP